MPGLPASLKALKSKEIATEPKTIGEHIRGRRLELGLTQRQAGEILGVTEWTVANWEKGYTQPTINARQAVVVFLVSYPNNPAT